MPVSFSARPYAMVAGVAGAVLAIVFVIFAFMAWRGGVPGASRPPVVESFDGVSAHRAWKEEAARLASLTPDASKESIRLARETLMDMRIPAEDRELQGRLVLALLAFERGDIGAYEQVKAAIQAIP